jgi:hypothetical protein
VHEGAEEFGVVLLREADLDRGVGAMEGSERLEDAAVDWRPDDADVEGSAKQPAQRGDGFSAVVERGYRSAGVGQEHLARGCEAGSPLVPVKEGLPEFCSKAPDLMADRRLGDRDADGRARELLLLGDCDEVRELSDIHNRSLWRTYCTRLCIMALVRSTVAP